MLREAIKDYVLPSTNYFTIKATSDGKIIVLHLKSGYSPYTFGYSSVGAPELYGRMWKPAGFNHRSSYPALVHVYGGPYSQMVTISCYVRL